MQNEIVSKFQNVTLKLGDNPIQCDCHVLDFFKHTKRNVLKLFQKNIIFDIDDLYCGGPYWVANKSVKSLNPKDIRCDWLRTKNADACNDICTCWKFPEERKILADCSERNLTQIPNLVGMYNEWSIELNVSGNRIERVPSLKNDIFKKIKVLDLSNNAISSISTDIFSESLQVLKLHKNNISNLECSVIQYLEKQNIVMSYISLYDNPWKCDCGSKKLTQLSSINNTYNLQKMRCKNDDALLFKVNFTEKCTSKNNLPKKEIRNVPYYISWILYY